MTRATQIRTIWGITRTRVLGDAVNLASRLCANAAGGQILISESTFRELGEQFPSRRLEPIRVKGKETPVEIHEICWQEKGSGHTTAKIPEQQF